MKDIKDMTIEELERELRLIDERQAELKALRFKMYPKEVRAIMKKLGWAPEDTGKVIRRTTGSFKAGK